MIVYTDGACKGNNQKDELKRKAGIGIYSPKIDLKVARRLPSVFHGIVIKISNNSAELFAILNAIILLQRLATEGALDGYNTILFVSDSVVAIGICLGIYKGSKMASLAKLTRAAIQLIETRHNIKTRFKWVKGHGSDLGNIKADELSNKGVLMEDDL